MPFKVNKMKNDFKKYGDLAFYDTRPFTVHDKRIKSIEKIADLTRLYVPHKCKNGGCPL